MIPIEATLGQLVEGKRPGTVLLIKRLHLGGEDDSDRMMDQIDLGPVELLFFFPFHYSNRP